MLVYHRLGHKYFYYQYICILIIYVGLMLNIHYNSRELYKAIEFSTVSICAVILWILVWSFKKSLLPKNIDEILEKAFNLNKISENKFVKKESEQSNFVFSYNIKKRRMIHRYLREFGFKKYIIYSEVMINKNSFNSNKINEDFFYDLRKQYWFLNFTFSDFGEEIRIIITPLYDYYDTVSAKYVVAILLSMYELAEKIVNKINSENL